jgi:tellurite resistance protein TehA-like permease
MESPVEDFDVLNVIPLFLGLTDISLVSPMLVFLIILFIFVIVYYYLIGEPALSDNPQGFLVSW